MKTALRLLWAVALTALPTTSYAATIYTSSASFLTQVAPGYYTETFNGLGGPGEDAPTNFAGGGFAYTVSAPGGLYASGEFLGTNLPDEALTFTFTSGNVTAVGGNWYATDLDDNFRAVSLTLNLSDGTTITFTPTSVVDSYRGFVSTVNIVSLVLSAQGPAVYGNVDNLTVGRASSPVPEPVSLALLGLGFAGLGLSRRRKA